VKIKVLKKFRDKHTGKIHKVGTVFDVPKERFVEINKTDASLVEAVEEKAEDTATEEKKPAKKAKTK
jgi:hypothetical protein